MPWNQQFYLERFYCKPRYVQLCAQKNKCGNFCNYFLVKFQMAIPGLLKRNSSPDTQKVTVKDFALNTEHIFQQF